MILAGCLVGLAMVCTTVLAALKVVPGDAVMHLGSVVVGGALGFLTPTPKATT
jgi:hypothetical protein